MPTIAPAVLAACRSAIDAAHAADPECVDGRPAELVYADRVEAWMPRLLDDCSDFDLLAGRCQHLERWAIPRDSYPKDRHGYLTWRRDLAARQGQRAAELCAAAGLDAALCERLDKLVAKRAPKTDATAQAMEDAACLVFLQHHALDFAPTQGVAKMIPIVQKTWAKMSERGHDLALQLELHPAVAEIVGKALS